jgi:acyl-coenzyme A thioesterase PaaI-like protein
MAGTRVTQKKRKKRSTAKYTYLGCPLTHNRTPWCFRLCTPDEGGHGYCGRVAPHSLQGAIGKSIAKFKKKKDGLHFEKLERMHERGAISAQFKATARVSSGTAEVTIPIRKKHFNAVGVVDSALYYKALHDAAGLAVASLIKDALVVGVSFNTIVTHPVERGTLTARAKFLTEADDLYMAEAILTDGDGQEVGRGRGSFMRTTATLSEDIGYK